MSSVNNKANFGIDPRLPSQLGVLQTQVDNLIQIIDNTLTNSKVYQTEFNKQLDLKLKAAKEAKDSGPQKTQKKEDLKDLQKLPENIVDDIKFGAENIRVAIKEKHLGRLAGKKRGETAVMYSNDILTILMSSCMIVILMFVSRQLNVVQSRSLCD